MQLTTFSDYSLRVLIFVGARGDEQLSTIQEIADQYGISRHHLVKVVNFLSHEGYLRTVRGQHGGFTLAQPAAKIGIGNVMRATEHRLDLVPCFSSSTEVRCVIEPACVLKGALKRALVAFFEVMDEYTLADLIKPQRRLRALLGASGAYTA